MTTNCHNRMSLHNVTTCIVTTNCFNKSEQILFLLAEWNAVYLALVKVVIFCRILQPTGETSLENNVMTGQKMGDVHRNLSVFLPNSIYGLVNV